MVYIPRTHDYSYFNAWYVHAGFNINCLDEINHITAIMALLKFTIIHMSELNVYSFCNAALVLMILQPIKEDLGFMVDS